MSLRSRIHSLCAPGNQSLLALAGLFLLLGAGFLWVVAQSSPIPGRLLFGLWRGSEIAVAAPLVGLAVLAAARYFSKSNFYSVLLSFGSVGVLVALIELAGILGVVEWKEIFKKPVSNLSWEPTPYVNETGTTQQDTASAWGMPAESIDFHFITDRHGFRNDDDRPGAEIYVLGDSIVVGALVPAADTVTAQLETLLGRTTMQVALSGLSPQAEHDLILSSELPLEGRTVIQFLFEGNDLLDSRQYRQASPGVQRAPQFKDRLLLNHLLVQLQYLTQPQAGEVLLRTCEIGEQAFTFGWTKNSFQGVQDEYEHIFSAIRDFRLALEARGATLALVVVPKKLRVLGPLCQFGPDSDLTPFEAHLGEFPQRVAGFAEQNAIPVLDLTDALAQSAISGDVPWFWGDTHWNATGHRVAAAAVARWHHPAP